jgi:hypothetical protein
MTIEHRKNRGAPSQAENRDAFLRDPHANRVKMTLHDIVSQLEVTLIAPQKEWHFVCYFFFSLALTTVQLDTKLRLRFTNKGEVLTVNKT